MMLGIPFRIFAVVAGLAGLWLIGLVCWRTARKFHPSPYWNLPEGQTSGFFRTRAHQALLLAPVSLFVVCVGLSGREFLSDHPVLMLGPLVASTLLIWSWERVEREFAWPGWLVPPEVRDVQGDYFVRRTKRQGG